jgi:hypothetical protein
VQSTYKPPPGLVSSKKVRKKRNKRKKPPYYVQACRFFLDHGGFATKFRQGRTLPYAWNPLLPVTNGTMSAYALRISDYPVCHPASVVLWPRLT